MLSALSSQSGVLLSNLVASDKKVWFNAGLLRARWEFLKKLMYHTGLIERAIEPFRAPAVLKDLPWPEITVTELRKAAEQSEPELLLGMVQTVALLVGKPRPENLPDYRGQFLQTLAAATLTALEGTRFSWWRNCSLFCSSGVWARSIR